MSKKKSWYERVGRERYRRRFAENPLVFRERTKRRDSARRAYLSEKKSAACMDCGAKYPPYVMDFDHRESSDKVGGVGSMAMSCSFQRLEAEIAKCDLVCANCHRERTHRRRQYVGPSRRHKP